jgi:hypothetical protein
MRALLCALGLACVNACDHAPARAPAPLYAAEDAAMIVRDLEGVWRGEALVRDAPSAPARRQLASLTLRPSHEGGLVVTVDTSDGVRTEQLGYLFRDGAVVTRVRPGVEEAMRVTTFEAAQRGWVMEGVVPARDGATRIRQVRNGGRFQRIVTFTPAGTSTPITLYAGLFSRVSP